MDGVVNKCQVCTEAVSKYKCPKCRVKYYTLNTVYVFFINIGSSSVLKTLLKNCHLREMIKEVDSAHKTDVVIQRAMMEPIFTEFVDVCLSIADPVKDEELESDEDM
nr:zinc finger HIT domain-containing protein 3-like [Procambarus clarkii]